jgi:hypothetical protein
MTRRRLNISLRVDYLSGSHKLWAIYVMNKRQASRWTVQVLCCVKQSRKSVALSNKLKQRCIYTLVIA